MKFFLKDDKYKIVLTEIELPSGVAGVVLSKYIWDKQNLEAIKKKQIETPTDDQTKDWVISNLAEKKKFNPDCS